MELLAVSAILHALWFWLDAIAADMGEREQCKSNQNWICTRTVHMAKRI